MELWLRKAVWACGIFSHHGVGRSSSPLKHPPFTDDISSKYADYVENPLWSTKGLGFWKLLPEKYSQWVLPCKPLSWCSMFRIACGGVVRIREVKREKILSEWIELSSCYLWMRTVHKYLKAWQMDKGQSYLVLQRMHILKEINASCWNRWLASPCD